MVSHMRAVICHIQQAHSSKIIQAHCVLGDLISQEATKGIAVGGPGWEELTKVLVPKLQS